MALGNVPEGYVRVIVMPVRHLVSRGWTSWRIHQFRSIALPHSRFDCDARSSGVSEHDLLAKCEVECQYARIKELYFEGPVLHRTLLSDQLIEAGPANFSSAIRR